MLMFENVPSKSEGYVVLPLEDYNRLLRATEMIKLRKRKYLQDRLELEIDKEVVYEIGIKLLKERYNAEDYDIIPFDDFYVSDVSLAMPKKES